MNAATTLIPIGLEDIKKQVAVLQVSERFFDSVVLFALFELGIFKELDNAKTWEELHVAVNGDRETLRAVLDAAVALKILAKEGAAYKAPIEFVDCLGRQSSPAYLGEWIAFLHALTEPLFKLGEAVNTGQPPGALFEDMSEHNLPARRMTRAMDAYARTRGIEIAERVDFSETRTLLDLGCGPGTYSLALLARYPDLHATLLDLPDPSPRLGRLCSTMGSWIAWSSSQPTP